MNKKVVISAIITLSIFMQGCSASSTPKNSKDSNTAKTTTAESANKTESSSNNQTSSSSQSEVSSQSDYSKYTGNWVKESSLKEDYKYGTSVSIKVDKDGNLTGVVGSSSDNASHVANVDISGKISNNEFNYAFKEDGWGHKGTINIKFEDNKIVLSMKYSEGSSKENLWGIGEGTFTLVNDNSKAAGNLQDLKNGGLQVIDNQSFGVKLNNYGNVKFISGLKREEGYSVVKFYLVDNNNNVLYKFPDFYGNFKGNFTGIGAISFTDVNGDGAKDVVVIGNYATNKDNHDTISSIYFSKGKTFANNKSLDDKLNESANNKTISSVIKFAKNAK